MLRRTALAQSSTSSNSFLALRKAKLSDLKRIPDVAQCYKFLGELRDDTFSGTFTTRGGNKARPIADLLDAGVATPLQIDHAVTSAFATFTLHTESRIANAMGKGYYTIGPCGEELIAPIGLILRSTDPVALHYRHLAPSIARRLAASGSAATVGSSFLQRTLDEILLDRAKGYCVASTDPVCGGHHCCLGGGAADFLVTSTLASQSCPALGRAMGIALSNKILPEKGSGSSKKNRKKRKQQQQQQHDADDDNSHLSADHGHRTGDVPNSAAFPADAVSFVTLGDGSINNAHFLSALNLADYATHRSFKVPVVFCITDNDLCISLKGNKFVDKFLDRGAARFHSHVGLGSDAVDTWLTAHQAVAAARKTKKPQVLVLQDITRRFGHAATDRQNAYLTRAEIEAMANRNPLLGFCEALVEQGLYSHTELAERFEATWAATQKAFDIADQEPKISTRAQVSRFNAAPLVDMVDVTPAPAPVPAKQQHNHNIDLTIDSSSNNTDATAAKKDDIFVKPPATDQQPNDQLSSPFVFRGAMPERSATTHVMRKHMTRVFDELLSCPEYRDVVYIGEDVQHGGYYLVTDGLAAKHPLRILDFPPDETSLVGAGLGFSQCGMTPVVEIPYAKYLDCGFDAFTEAIIMHWLSRGRERNGVVFRLQGFGRGVFGGNYHTHNMLHIPPGLDVVCCSRGDDYARMMRYAVAQARGGRMVMFVDCTELLNLREVAQVRRSKEAAASAAACWEFPYSAENEFITFDDVTVYRSVTPGVTPEEADAALAEQNEGAATTTSGRGIGGKSIRRVAVVTYGNGLVAALEADLAHNSQLLDLNHSYVVDIIDCRCLSQVPQGLKDALYATAYDAVLFADPCKFGGHPLNMHFAMFVNWKANGKSEGAKQLPVGKMKSIGAEFTYNPLGTKLTFLNASDIVEALVPLLRD